MDGNFASKILYLPQLFWRYFRQKSIYNMAFRNMFDFLCSSINIKNVNLIAEVSIVARSGHIVQITSEQNIIIWLCTHSYSTMYIFDIFFLSRDCFCCESLWMTFSPAEFALPSSVFCPSVLLSHLKHVFLCVILFHLSMVIHNPHGQIILPWRGKIRVHIRHFGLQKLEVTNFLAKLIEKKLRHSEDILHCLQHNIKEILRISIVKVTTAVFFLH